MRKFFSTILLLFTLIPAAFIVSGFLFLPDSQSIFDQIKSEVIKQAGAAFSREVDIESVDGNLLTSISLNNVRIAKNKTLSDGDIIKIKKVVVYYNILKAGFSADILPAIYKIDFIEPDIDIQRDLKGEFNFLNLIAPPQQGEPQKPLPFKAKIEIINGHAFYGDERGFAVKPISHAFSCEAQNINGIIDLTIKNRLFLESKLDVRTEKGTIPMSLNGNLNLSNNNFKFTVSSSNVDIKNFGSYILNIPNINFENGAADVNLTIKSAKKKFPVDFDGNIYIKSGILSLFKYNITGIDGQIILHGDEIKFVNMAGNISDIPVVLNGKFNDFENMKFNLKLSSKDAKIGNALRLSEMTKNIELSGIGNLEILIGGDIGNPKISGSLLMSDGILYKHPISGKCDFEFGSQALIIKIAETKLFNGIMFADGKINFSGTTPKIKAGFQLKDIDLFALSQNNQGISGRTSGSVNVDGTADKLKVSSNLNLNKSSIFGQQIDQIVSNVEFADGKINFKQLNIKGSGAEANLSGYIDKNMRFLISTKSHNFVLKTIIENFGVISGRLDDFEGTVLGIFDKDFFSKPYKTLSAKGNVKISDATIRNQKLTSISGSFSFGGEKLTLSDMILTNNDTRVSISGEAGIGIQSQIIVRGKDVKLSDLTFINEFLPVEISRIDGSTSFSARIYGFIPKETKISDIDLLKTVNCDINTNANSGCIGDQKFDQSDISASFSKGVLNIDNFSIKTPASDIRIFGSIDKDFNLNLDTSGTLDILDIHMFTAKYGRIAGQINIKSKIEGKIDNPNIKCRFDANNLRYNNIFIDSASGKIKVTDKKILSDDDIIIGLDGDSYKISGFVDFSKPMPYVKGKVQSIKGGLGSIAKAVNMVILEINKQTKIISSKDLFTPHSFKQSSFYYPSEFSPDDQVVLYTPGKNGDKTFNNYWDDVMASYNAYKQNLATSLNISASGKLDGSVDLEGTLANMSGNMWLKILNGRFEKYNFSSLELKATLADNNLNIKDFKIEKEKGSLQIKGNLSLEKISVGISSNEMPLDILSLLPFNLPTDGKVKLNAAISGSYSSPEVSAQINAKNISWGEILIPSAIASINADKNGLLIKKLNVSAADQSINIAGKIPFTLNDEIDLKLNLAGNNVGILSNIFRGVKWDRGNGNAQLILSGNIGNPKLNGNISVNHGKITVFNGDSHIENLDTNIIISDNLIKIDKLNGMFTGKATNGITNYLNISGNVDLRNMIKDWSIGLDLILADTEVNLNVPQLISGTISAQNTRIKGLYYLGTPGAKVNWAKISGNFTLHDSTLYSSSNSSNSSGRIITLLYNLTAALGKNVYLLSGDSGRAIVGDFSSINLLIDSDILKITGSYNVPNIDGIVQLKSGSISILTRDFSIVSYDSQKTLFAKQLGKSAENTATFNGGIMPNLNVLAMSKVQDSKKQSDGTTITNNIDIFSRISGIPFSSDTIKSVKINFEAYTEDSTKTPVELVPATYSDSEIKVMLLPDYLKGALGLSSTSQQSVDTRTVVVDVVSARLQSVLLRSVERSLERALGLESLTLNYNFGKDLEKAAGIQSQPQQTASDQTKFDVGFVKGFFDRLYIGVRYKQALEQSNAIQNTSLNYQITWKINQALAFEYYREPLNFQSVTNTYYKTSLNYTLRF